AVGDLDGDGLADFLVTSYANAFGGTVTNYVFYGSRQRLPPSQTLASGGVPRVTVANSTAVTPVALDLDADGKRDLVISASVTKPGAGPGGTVGSEGRIYVFYGRGRIAGELASAQADAVVGSSLHGPAQAMAPIGDVDGDGYPDLFVGGTPAPPAFCATTKMTDVSLATIIHGGGQRLHGELHAGDVGTTLCGDFPGFYPDAVGLRDIDG